MNTLKAYNEANFETVIKYLPDFIFDDVPKEEVLNGISKNHTTRNIDTNLIK